MAGTEDPTYGRFSCFIRGCDNPSPSCFFICNNYYLIPPPPPPPPSSQNHIAPFLIATVCILGISFLLLSTCTIIFRLRFTSRRRGVSPASSDDSPINEDNASVDHPIWHITTVGLQQSVIDSITAFKYKKIDGFFVDEWDSSCSVCLTEFEEGDDLRLLPKCSHAFHVLCIDTWLRSHKNCPLCRAPIVNENIQRANSGAGTEGERRNLEGDDSNNEGLEFEGGEGSSHHRLRERGDVLGELPVLEGIRIAEILKKNRELRVFSDLSENNRFRRLEVGVEPVRRASSFNAVAASAICGAVVSNEGSSSEGCSLSADGNSKVVVQEKKIELEKGDSKRGLSMSGSLMKSLSIGQTLQKGPVSMKRSLSSSSRFFSFRRTRSQASVLPL